MENLKELNCIELDKEELVQIGGGGFWKVVDFIYRAFRIQEAVNDFKDGWDSVNCECVEKQIEN